jgi:hypothetical protein
VECASALSRKRRTVALQLFAWHLNSCARRPLITTTFGVGSKKAYIGEFHCFVSRSIDLNKNILDFIGH